MAHLERWAKKNTAASFIFTMKARIVGVLACLSSAAVAEESSPAFSTPKIELPSLLLLDGAKKERPAFFREDGPWFQNRKPAFSAEKKTDPGIIVPRDDLDPKMIIIPQSSVDFKLRVIPGDQKK